jgi:HEPN domain-containing protein
LAEAKLGDAKLLLSAGRADNAYYLAGYAVELMLKAIVSKRFRTDTLPDRAVSTQVFVHDLRKLIGLALLEVALKEREKADAGFSGSPANRAKVDGGKSLRSIRR